MVSTGGPVECTSAPVEWRPGPGAVVAMSLLGVVLFVVGLAGFVVLFAVTHPGVTGFTVGTSEFLVGLVAYGLGLAALMAVHELVHGVAVRLYGGRPTYGVTMIAKVLPALTTAHPGHRFGRGRYVVVALAPTVLLTAILAALVPLPWGGWLVLPAALHLSGCSGDLVLVWKVLTQPRGTRFEDQGASLLLHPAADPA